MSRKYQEYDKYQDRERNKYKTKDKERQREREKERQKQRQKFRDKDIDKLHKDKNQKKKKYYSDEQSDIDKKKKKKYKSRSRSDSYRRNNYRRQRERSRSPRKNDKHRRKSKQRRRSKDRKNFRFDSPPKSDKSDMSQDPQKMQQLNHMKATQELVSSKADRKLYLGNLPPNITANQLMQLLNSALKKMQINTDPPGDSIASAWISPDGVGHYAFIQFRTAQEASNGMALNNASLFGYQLKLGRPKQYLEYNKQLLSQLGNDADLDGIYKKIAAMRQQEQQLKVQQRIICPPSRVLILKHIVTLQQLAIDEQYNEIMTDVKQMAQRFGKVVSITIPRPHQIINLQQAPKRIKGLGYVFIEYENLQNAKKARKQFIGKMFSGRSVACGYFSETRYKLKELDLVEKVIINF